MYNITIYTQKSLKTQDIVLILSYNAYIYTTLKVKHYKNHSNPTQHGRNTSHTQGQLKRVLKSCTGNWTELCTILHNCNTYILIYHMYDSVNMGNTSTIGSWCVSLIHVVKFQQQYKFSCCSWFPPCSLPLVPDINHYLAKHKHK